MIKKTILLSAFLLSIAMLADPNDPANPPQFQPPPNQGEQIQQPPPQGQEEQMQPPSPANYSYQSQNPSASDLNQEFEKEAEHGSLLANEPKPNTVMFDIKTSHGSITIKKLPPKPNTDTQKTADTQKMPDTQTPATAAPNQTQQQK